MLVKNSVGRIGAAVIPPAELNAMLLQSCAWQMDRSASRGMIGTELMQKLQSQAVTQSYQNSPKSASNWPPLKSQVICKAFDRRNFLRVGSRQLGAVDALEKTTEIMYRIHGTAAMKEMKASLPELRLDLQKACRELASIDPTEKMYRAAPVSAGDMQLLTEEEKQRRRMTAAQIRDSVVFTRRAALENQMYGSEALHDALVRGFFSSLWEGIKTVGKVVVPIVKKAIPIIEQVINS